MLHCDQIIITKLVRMHLLLPFSLMMDTELYLNPAFPIHTPGKKFVHYWRMHLSSPSTPETSTVDTPRMFTDVWATKINFSSVLSLCCLAQRKCPSFSSILKPKPSSLLNTTPSPQMKYFLWIFAGHSLATWSLSTSLQQKGDCHKQHTVLGSLLTKLPWAFSWAAWHLLYLQLQCRHTQGSDFKLHSGMNKCLKKRKNSDDI